MHFIKIIFAHSIRILLGLIFIASGYLKLFPIEPFELNFIDLGIANWYTAPIIARGLIGFEFLLGVLLILNLGMNKFTIKATYGILLFFTAYLIYQLITIGNNGNCGCFGTYLQMTPLESIAKNIIMLLILITIHLFPARFVMPGKYFLIPFIFSISFTAPYILNVPDALISGHRTGAVNYPLQLKRIYSDTTIVKPAIDLSSGKKIVAFMSLTCGHCKMSALKMHVLQQRNQDFPFYILLHGDSVKHHKEFFDFSKAQNISHSYFNNADFYSFVGGSLPAIFWVQNDTVKFRSLYIDLNENEIKTWLRSGQVPFTNDTIRNSEVLVSDTTN